MVKYPNANVTIVEGYSANIIEEVKAGTIDFGVVPGLAPDSGLRGRVFAKSAEVFVSAPGGPQEDRVPVSLKDLPPLKLVLPSSAQARRAHLDRFLASSAARIERIIDMDSMFVTLDFVAKSDWATILPSIMLRDFDGHRFKINPFAGAPLYLDLVLIESLRRPLSTIADAFFGFIEEEAEAAIEAMNHKLAQGVSFDGLSDA